MTKQQLIEDNMKLVYEVIHRHFPTYIKDEDIVQCGMVGLCTAAEKFDESKSNFCTFAYVCIKRAIQMELRSRQKHKGVLSLDYETVNNEGEMVAFGDCLVGDEDVGYVDIGIDYNALKPHEQAVYELLLEGVNIAEIARQLGKPKQAIWATVRKLKLKARLS